jgi:hypothetical protein
VATILASYDIPNSALPWWIRETLIKLLDGSEESFVKKDVPVHDIIFGWKLNLLYNITELLAPMIGITLPPELQKGRFGFFLDVRRP